MVEHLLSHARLTAGRYATDPEWRSLQQVHAIRRQVALTATATGTGLAVTIVDAGDGIPADMVEQIMEPFTQTRRSGSQALKDARLGFSIAHSLVELHGDELKIAPKEGSGTTVTVRLPAA